MPFATRRVLFSQHGTSSCRCCSPTSVWGIRTKTSMPGWRSSCTSCSALPNGRRHSRYASSLFNTEDYIDRCALCMRLLTLRLQLFLFGTLCVEWALAINTQVSATASAPQIRALWRGSGNHSLTRFRLLQDMAGTYGGHHVGCVQQQVGSIRASLFSVQTSPRQT